ncbi:ABC transporter ATP-binding protein [candidate division WOR-3 bacterium]|nr:ABC transporter ATP-binding protein [candidate division WOR-3 bacterium]
MHEDIIRVEKVTKDFGKVRAIDCISLSVKSNEIYGLIGPDGSGKSTLIRILSTVMNPSSGVVEILGLNPSNNPEKIKNKIGYVSQNFGLYRDLTVEENIKFYADIYEVDRKECRQKSSKFLEMYNLSEFVKRKAGHLSGGMKQKLSLICALIHKPQIIFLDEPTNGVDPVSRMEFWKILSGVTKEGTSVFISTSYIDEAEKCDSISLIFNGKIIAQGTPDSIKGMFTGKIIKIVCKKPGEIARCFDGINEVSDVFVYGDFVNVLTFKNNVDVSFITDVLERKNSDYYETYPVEPGLEDVFISMMKGLHA